MASPPTQPSRSLQILKIVLYILAGLVLALGLIIGISLMVSATSIVSNALLPIQLLGGGAIANLISRLLSGFLVNLGLIVLILSLILTTLLYALGRLMDHTAQIEARLARLEEKS